MRVLKKAKMVATKRSIKKAKNQKLKKRFECGNDAKLEEKQEKEISVMACCFADKYNANEDHYVADFFKPKKKRKLKKL